MRNGKYETDFVYFETFFNKKTSEKLVKTMVQRFEGKPDNTLNIFMSHGMSGIDTEAVIDLRKRYMTALKQMIEYEKTFSLGQPTYSHIFREIVNSIMSKIYSEDMYEELFNSYIRCGNNLTVNFIDNYTHKDIPEDAGRLVHLGRSIQQMNDADLVVFCGLCKSNGCKVEEEICELYDIPYMKFDLKFKGNKNGT